METVPLLPDLHLLRFPVGQAYLWRDPDGLTLIDTGPPGSGAAVADAVRRLGHRTADVHRIVLTHFHADHAGSTGEIAAWHGAPVLAGRADASVIRGDAPAPPPVLTDDDRELFDRIHGAGESAAGGDWPGSSRGAGNGPDRSGRSPRIPPTPPAPVDRELGDGDVLPVAGGATVLAVPGHTPGSVALHLPGPDVLFTGDTVATAPGRVLLGVFNVDHAAVVASFRRLAGLGAGTVCVGHGDPIVRTAAEELNAAAERLGG